MSYATFHLVFTLPPVVLMALTLRRPLAEVGGWRARWALPLLSLIAFTYTTPWDNYLVAREVWWYGEARVLATIGHVPVEEYFFFLIQPVLTGLFLYHVLSRTRLPRPGVPQDSAPVRRTPAPWIGMSVWLLIAAAGFALLASDWDHGVYLGLILSWASPVLAGMWLYDGHLLWHMRRTLVVAIGIPTLYLWIADALAIRNGIWTISSRYTVGVNPFGLPVEEATFFLVTNMLVVKGILLLLYGEHYALASTTGSNSPVSARSMASG
jgi:lycopene cyclase domain-containing protein